MIRSALALLLIAGCVAGCGETEGPPASMPATTPVATTRTSPATITILLAADGSAVIAGEPAGSARFEAALVEAREAFVDAGRRPEDIGVSVDLADAETTEWMWVESVLEACRAVGLTTIHIGAIHLGRPESLAAPSPAAPPVGVPPKEYFVVQGPDDMLKLQAHLGELVKWRTSLMAVDPHALTPAYLVLDVLRACRAERLRYVVLPSQGAYSEGVTLWPMPTIPVSPPLEGEEAAEFFRTSSARTNVVFLIDRSGSMLESLGPAKREFLRSISRLQEARTFHLIFFGQDLREAPARRLVRATEGTKRTAARFLRNVTAGGVSRCQPGIRRAFEVIGKSGKPEEAAIFLLTDSEFSDNSLVVKTIGQLNVGRKVQINTILLHHDSKAAKAVLQGIAKRNGGEFKYIAEND